MEFLQAHSIISWNPSKVQTTATWYKINGQSERNLLQCIEMARPHKSLVISCTLATYLLCKMCLTYAYKYTKPLHYTKCNNIMVENCISACCHTLKRSPLLESAVFWGGEERLTHAIYTERYRAMYSHIRTSCAQTHACTLTHTLTQTTCTPFIGCFSHLQHH